MASYQNYSEQPETKKSKYNAAIAQLYRLDGLLQDANRHARSNNFIKWNLDLDALWRELSEDVTLGGEEHKRYLNFNDRLVKSKFFSLGNTNGFSSPSQQYLMIKSIHYQILSEKEIWLRQLMNKFGKGTQYEDDIADYME